MTVARRLWLVPLLIGLLGSGPRSAWAQDVEPRGMTPAPVGTNVFGATYLYSWGQVLLDKSLAITDADGGIHTFNLSYSRFLSLAGRTARVDALLPLAQGKWTGQEESDGEDLEVERTGLGDPGVQLEVFLYGAPAMTREEFAAYEQRTVVSAHVRVRVPLGGYDEDRLINLGSNRWKFATALGASHKRGRWQFEGAGAVWLFSDNTEGYGGASLSQDPIWALQGSISFDITPRSWISLGMRQTFGGDTAVNGESNHAPREINRLGLILALPLARGHSLRFVITTPAALSSGDDFSVLGSSYLRTW